MQSDRRVFEDFSRMASGALGAMSGARAEIEALFRQRLDRLVSDLDLVTRDDYEAVRDLAAKARSEQEDLLIRLAALELRITALERQSPATEVDAAELYAPGAAPAEPAPEPSGTAAASPHEHEAGASDALDASAHPGSEPPSGSHD